MLFWHFIRALLSFLFLLGLSYMVMLLEPSLEKYQSIFDFAKYMSNVTTLNWGSVHGRDLFSLLIGYVANTLLLALPAFFLALLLGIFFHVMNYLFAHSATGMLLEKILVLGLAIPVFFIAIVALYVDNSLLEQGGFKQALEHINLVERIWHIDLMAQLSVSSLTAFITKLYHELKILVLIIATPIAFEIMRLFNEEMKNLCKQNFIKVAQARGYLASYLWYHYFMRNLTIVLAHEIMRYFLLTLSFVLIIENIFDYPGLGRYSVQAITEQNIQATSACILMIGSVIIIINFLTKVFSFIINPMVRNADD